MGRKLNAFEESMFASDDASAPEQSRNGSFEERLDSQIRIAQALGVPVAALSPLEDVRDQALAEMDQTRAAEITLNRDCLELIQAYTRIADPEERRRLLELVRASADNR